ncbi:MAG: BREX-3 system P-loop-containing protein BrxF [Caldilineae bacterium]|nr:MAG: BREX-3 system P-loop-containing protein BrxF [Caldilineae bacterium]
MAVSLVDQILRNIDEARELYNRLILLVGPSGSGKTFVLQEVSTAKSVPLINVNLELSRRMLDLTEHQRKLRASVLLEEILRTTAYDPVLLDNTELLFDVRLALDPLRLLQRLSRNRTVVAAWNGFVLEHHLTYADHGHPEFRRYPIQDFIVIDLNTLCPE